METFSNVFNKWPAEKKERGESVSNSMICLLFVIDQQMATMASTENARQFKMDASIWSEKKKWTKGDKKEKLETRRR